MSLVTVVAGSAKRCRSPGRCPSDFATLGARTEHLFSKLIAGGLSAGVVLLWWPRVFPHDSAGAWVARGIAWTLPAEILVVAVSPLEHALRARVAALRPVGHMRSFFSASSRLRAYFALALSAVAVSLPLMLIATGHPAVAERPKPQRITKVTRVVKVVKQVKVKRVVVREAAPAADARAGRLKRARPGPHVAPPRGGAGRGPLRARHRVFRSTSGQPGKLAQRER